MSAINLLIKEPVIPFIRKKQEKEISKITLVHSVTVSIVVNGVMTPYREKRSASVIIANDDDMEVMIRLVITFIEASMPASLALTDGALFSEFRKCLGDIVLDTYDNLLASIQVRDRSNFILLVNDLVGHFADPTAFADQKRFMDTYTKPFKLSVRELGNRLIIVNKYTQYLPGSNGSSVYDENTIKNAFFNMMLPAWQFSFAGSAHTELNDPNYTYAMLKRYMITQETIHNRRGLVTPGGRSGNSANFGNRSNRNYQPYRPNRNPSFGGQFRQHFGRHPQNFGGRNGQPRPHYTPSSSNQGQKPRPQYTPSSQGYYGRFPSQG